MNYTGIPARIARLIQALEERITILEKPKRRKPRRKKAQAAVKP